MPKQTPADFPPGAGAPVSNATPVVQTQDPQVENQDSAPDHAPAGSTSTATKLTTRTSAEYGAKGRFVDATADDLASAPEGLLADPTPAQLARRRR